MTRELKDMKVRRIALVSGGANGDPVRVLKRADGVANPDWQLAAPGDVSAQPLIVVKVDAPNDLSDTDVSSIVAAVRAELTGTDAAPAPAAAPVQAVAKSELVFLQVNKAEGAPLADFENRVIPGAGLKVVRKSEDDKAVRWTFTETAADYVMLAAPGVAMGIAYSENLQTVLKSENYGDFSKALEQCGLLPMVRLGTQVFREAADSLTYDFGPGWSDPDTLKTRMGDLVRDYTNYVMGIIEMLPTPAVYIEKELPMMDLYKASLAEPVAKTEAAPAAAATTAAPAAVVAEAAPAAPAAPAAAAEAAPAAAEAAPAAAATEAAPAAPAAEAAPAAPAAVAEVVKTEPAAAAPALDMTALATLLKSTVADAIAPVTAELSGLKTQVSGIETRTQKAEDALKTATVGGVPAGDRIRKSAGAVEEDDSFSFDTALGRKP